MLKIYRKKGLKVSVYEVIEAMYDCINPEGADLFRIGPIVIVDDAANPTGISDITTDNFEIIFYQEKRTSPQLFE